MAAGKNGRGSILFIKNLENSQRFLQFDPQKTYQRYLLNMVAELEKLQMIDEGFEIGYWIGEKTINHFWWRNCLPHTINQGYAKTILNVLESWKSLIKKEMID